MSDIVVIREPVQAAGDSAGSWVTRQMVGLLLSRAFPVQSSQFPEMPVAAQFIATARPTVAPTPARRARPHLRDRLSEAPPCSGFSRAA